MAPATTTPSVSRSFTYDNLGRTKTETLQRRNSPTDSTLINLTTTYTYDAMDRVIQVQDALGNIVINRFDDNGQLWRVTHQYLKPDGSYDTRNVVTQAFDAADRVSTETDSLGGITTYQYDLAGNVIAVKDAENHTTRFEYDAMNRRTAVIDANGNRTTTAYNLRGEVLSITNAMGEITTFQYDALGRKTQMTDPHGYVTKFTSYDANGNLLCMVDANAQADPQAKNSDGCTESRQYDEFDRVTLIRDALNGTTATTYDLLGHPLTQIDAEGRKYSWTYDDLGRLQSETDFTGKTTSYASDEAGNVWQKTNRLAEVTQVTFDKLNRPFNTKYLKDNSTETTSYDRAGTVHAVANAAPSSNVTYTFAYDRLNRLQSKSDSRGKALSFTYDKTGNILTKTTYQGSTTSYTYDGANRLVNASNPDYLSVNYQYDAAGRLLSRVMSSGARSLYAYDSGGWLNSLTHYDAGGTTVGSSTYNRDRLGHITTLTSSGSATNYTLDALYRLTVVDAPNTANDEAFSYDHIGNRLTATRAGNAIGVAGSTTRYYVYNPATVTAAPVGLNAAYTPANNNRLKEIRIGSVSGTLDSGFTFDNEGQMLTQTGAGAKTFTWDGKGRLATVAMGGTTERYAYDPMNHRIKRSGGSLGNLDYFLEGDHLESVYSGGTLQEKYFRGSTIDELVAGYTYQSGSLTPVMFQHDQVMSVSATTKPNGGTQATATFWAFGETQATTGTLASRLMFTGRENDGTWLYQYRARYYDPSTGRFISEDPKGFAAGINFYAYAGNNPLDANDPSGMVYIFVGGAGDSSLSGIVRNYAADFRPLTGQQVIYRTWDQGSDIQKYIAGLPTGEPINLIGHSYGGDTAATIAANSSRRINMLVTIDPVSQIKPNFSAINQNTNMWVSVNATGGSAFEQSNLIAGLGGAWDSSPQGAATSYISAPKAVHADFGKMMSTTGPGARSPLDLINDSDIAGISGRLQSSAADGGFLLYPNKPNTNQMRSVYAK